MEEYFKLQFKMINRRFRDAGFEPVLAYIIFSLGFFGLSLYLFSKTEYAVYAYILIALTLIGKLSEIRRTEFLKICFGDLKLKKIRIAENLICSLPFFIFLLFKQLFLYVPVLFVSAVVLALVNFRTTLNFTILSPFSQRPFEFTIGFRNSFYLIFLAYVLTGIAVSVHNFNLGVFAMLFVFATTLSYYTKPENEYYVWIFNQNAREFLFHKIKTALLYSSFMALPVALVLAVFFHQNTGILLLFFLTGWAFLTCMIVSKYATYPDEINITQGILIALCIWFPPLLLALIPYLFRKSEKHLSHLLK